MASRAETQERGEAQRGVDERTALLGAAGHQNANASGAASKGVPPVSWAIVMLVFLTSFANCLNQGDRAVMPLAVIPMGEESGWSMSESGWVLGSFSIGYIMSQIPGGVLSTLLPSWLLLGTSVFAWSTFTAITPLAYDYGLLPLLTSRYFMGVFEGFCLPTCIKILTDYVPSHALSRAFSVLYVSGTAGVLAVTVVCPLLPDWPLMFYIPGAVGGAWCVAVVAFLAIVKVDVREDLGQEALRHNRLREGGDPLTFSDSFATYANLAKSPAVLALCAAQFASNAMLWTLAFWIPTYLHEIFEVPLDSMGIVAWPLLCGGLGTVASGQLADWALAEGHCSVLLLRRAATAFSLLVPAVCLSVLWAAPSLEVAIGILCVSAFSHGTYSVGPLANHADLTDEHAGFTFSVMNLFGTIPAITAGPLTAAVVEAAGGSGEGDSWLPVFASSAVLNVIGALVYVTLSRADRIDSECRAR